MTRRVIIIGERIADHREVSDDWRSLEDIEDSYFYSLVSGLERAGFSWTHMADPRRLLDTQDLHEGDVVLPLWSGRDSRNRRALTPAVCELLRLPYVGADAYASLICQDKILAKHYCSVAGLATPRHVVVPLFRAPADLAPVKFPCVVKPSLEGGSMGISDDCIVNSAQEALDLALVLRHEWKQPILIEEFAPGREVSICMMGRSGDVRVGCAEVVVKDSPNYFDTHLNGYELKKVVHRPRANSICSLREVESYIPDCMALFYALGKVDYIRIDGKLTQGNFTVLELTPDSHIGEGSSFAVALTGPDYNYEGLLTDLINLAT